MSSTGLYGMGPGSEEYPDAFCVVTRYDAVDGHSGIQIVANNAKIDEFQASIREGDNWTRIPTHRIAIMGSNCTATGATYFADIAMLCGTKKSSDPQPEGTQLLHPKGHVYAAKDGFISEYLTGYMYVVGISNTRVANDALGTVDPLEAEQWLDDTVSFLDYMLQSPAEEFDLVVDPMVAAMTGDTSGELLREKSYQIMKFMGMLLTQFQAELQAGTDVSTLRIGCDVPSLAFTYNGLLQAHTYLDGSDKSESGPE